jgi:N-acyl-phosphatidylethanolamine-hydrolysing phospholipase D
MRIREILPVEPVPKKNRHGEAMRYLVGVIFVLTSLSVACADNPRFDPEKPHHTPDGFQNVPPVSRGSFWKWRWERLRNGPPEVPPGGYRFEVLEPDRDYLASNDRETTVTWIGHATLLVQIGGVNILTDPHLSERASPVSFAGPKRVTPPALGVSELPRIDLVVLSHNHYDHLDDRTVKALAASPGGSPLFLVPLGLKEWFKRRGIENVREMDWWETETVEGLVVHFVPVQHWSARSPFDRNETLWGAWVVEGPGFRFFFCGDAGYSAHFREIARRFGSFDLAALPIGAYEPRWFMKSAHMNPEETVTVHQEINSRLTIGIQWGTFNLTDEPLDEPPKKLAEALASRGVDPGRFLTLRHGETIRLETGRGWVSLPRSAPGP